jgi:hypothetical protein
VDWVCGVTWVFEALGRQTVLPSDAPNPGTWAVYQWAKGDRNKFYRTVWPKALAAKEKRLEDSDEEVVKRDRRPLKEIGASLKAFWTECRDSRLNASGLPEEV